MKSLRQARNAAGLSLRALAQLTGVSAMALSKYERGLIKPSESVQAELCRALGVSEEFLEGKASESLTDVEYRAASRMTSFSKKRIHDEVRDKIDARLKAETLIPELRLPSFRVPRLPASIADFDAIEPIAERCRQAWQMGQEPVRNLTNRLEAIGIRTFMTSIEDGYFDGLSAYYGGEPIVVTGKDWPGDRQRFTLAHELGHFVLHDRLTTGMDEERACHRFASAFIAPREAFLEAVTHERITPFDLYTLKHDWGLSMGACLYRCADLGLVSASAARSLWREFRQSGWMAQEPGTQLPRELPTRFLRAVYAAWCAERLDTELASALLLDAADDLAAVLEMDVDEPSR